MKLKILNGSNLGSERENRKGDYIFDIESGTKSLLGMFGTTQVYDLFFHHPFEEKSKYKLTCAQQKFSIQTEMWL